MVIVVLVVKKLQFPHHEKQCALGVMSTLRLNFILCECCAYEIHTVCVDVGQANHHCCMHIKMFPNLLVWSLHTQKAKTF